MRKHVPLPLLLACACLAQLALAHAAAAQARVRITLEPQVIGVDESATLTVELEGAGLGGVRLRPGFQLENLEIVAGPYQSEDIRFENGAFSRSFRSSWRVRPLAVGPAGVKAVSLRVGDQVVRLPDRQIRVQEEPTGIGPDDEDEDPFDRLLGGGGLWPTWGRDEEGPDAAFLKAEISPARPYAGQQSLYTVYLYTREDVTAVSAREIPTFKGFWVHDIPRPEPLPTEVIVIDGQRYSRVILLQKALFPLRPGRRTIEPTAMDLLLRVTERRFFGPPLSRVQQLALRTGPAVLDVQPLPPAPAGYGGAVGHLRLAARLEPQTLRLGEAATLEVTLSGQGNLEGISAPDLPHPQALAVYPPQQDGGEQIAGTTVRTQRTWSYVVVPDRTGRYVLQAPQIQYFNPSTRSYQVATVPALNLTVLPRAETATASRGPGLGQPHGIREGETARTDGAWWPRLNRPGTLLGLFALPWGIVLVVTLLRRERAGPGGPAPAPAAAPSAGPAREGYDPREARRRLEERLAEAQSEARPRQAALLIESAWRDLLTERWGGLTALPLDRWGREAQARGEEAAVAADLGRLAEDLQFLRQAPQLSATEAVRGEVAARSRSLLRRLK